MNIFIKIFIYIYIIKWFLIHHHHTQHIFFDLSGVYFNSTTQSSGSSSVDLDELDKRYLLKAGGNISNNLVVDGSLDVKTALTLPIIGNVESTIQGKQNTINDGDLTIANKAELQTT